MKTWVPINPFPLLNKENDRGNGFNLIEFNALRQEFIEMHWILSKRFIM